MSDHWPGWPDDDPFGHDPGHPTGGDDPLAHDPARGPDGDPFHDARFTTDTGFGTDDGGDPAADGWDDDAAAPGHTTGLGDAPAAGYGGWDHPGTDLADADPGDAPGHDPGGDDAWQDTTGHGMGPVGADPDALTDPGDGGDVFPPSVDVGPLPEPVDGFPWIDTGSLGVIDPDAVPAGLPDGAPDGAGLAEYAAADLPPGVDPWAELAASDDPATSALARFWHPQQ